MPHSSGGGFSGGGFHGGSYGGYHGSGNSKPSGISRTYYAGSRRYYFINRGKLDSVYSNENISSRAYRKRKITAASLLISIPVLIIAIIFYIHAAPGKKLNSKYVKTTDVSITDTADIFSKDEEEKLEEVLEDFYEVTGVPVEILTVTHADWNQVEPFKTYYHSLERFTYDKYLEKFEDEGHWLLVYSVKRSDTGKSTWNWEGMQGNDTDSVLSEKKTNRFNKNLQEKLQNKDYKVSEAFIDAFEDLKEHIFEFELTTDGTGVLVAVAFEGAIFVFWGIAILVKTKRYYDVEKNPKVIVCIDCGKKYVGDSERERCPYCCPYDD